MSKNNFDERLRKMEPKEDHFSIRKFSVGVASVLIGFSFLGLANSQVVKADTGAQPQTVQAKQSVSASDQQKAVAQNSQKQLNQGYVPANDSQSKQTLTAIQAAAVQAMQKQQAAEIARKNSRLPEDQKPAKTINAAVGLAGRKEVQGAVKGIADQIGKTTGSETQTVKDASQKDPAVVFNKKDDTAQEAAVKSVLPAKQAADEKVKVDKKNQEYQTITLEDLSVSDQNALAKSLGMSLKQLQTEVASNTSGIVIPASEWLGNASWRYQTINMQTGVLKANTDTDLPFKIISKIKGGSVAHNRDYELRIQLDHRLDPYVAGIKVSQQGDVNDDNAEQKPMTKNADGSWSLPLFRLDGGVMGLANVDVPYTNPHCEIEFNDQVNNFYANLGDLKNNPLQYAIYGYDKKTGKVIGDYKSTGYVISQESPFNQPVATGKDANRAGNTNQPYYQGAGLTIQYDKDTNTINALYNPSMLSEWTWDPTFGQPRIDKLNYLVDPRLVPFIDKITLKNYKAGIRTYPFNSDGASQTMKVKSPDTDLAIAKGGNYIGEGNVQITSKNMSISGWNHDNHYVGIAFHLNKNLGEVIKDLALEEKANSRLMFGVYFTARNGKMAPNTLATNAFDIDKLGQADNYQPEYTAVTVTKGDSTTPAVSGTSLLSWGNKAPTNAPTYAMDMTNSDKNLHYMVDQKTGNILVTPTAQANVGQTSMAVVVTYSDGSVDKVKVPITVKDVKHHVTGNKDSDEYRAVYGHKTAYVGAPVNFDAPDIQKNGKNADSSVAVSYQAVSTTPAWAQVNSNGTISIAHAPAVGFYNIPVQVTYRDGSSNSAYAALTVINRNQKVNWDSNSSVSVYRSSVNNYHKTNDNSAHDTEITKDVPTIDRISWTNFETKDHKPETIVYVRQADGSYKLISGVGFKDANGDIAPLTIARGQITSVWKAGFEGNSDASNFPKTGTGTSLAKDQWNDANGEQQEQTGEMAGNSKARILGHFGADAEKILGVKNSDDFWFNVYSNYYGAKATGAVQTFKQGQDISNLSQAQYRQLVDVTDLGQNGWNGININPDAPQVLAYVPGTNSSKTFYMTWAPGKEASTAKVANGVDGTVRIHFGDGTWLDIAVKINVKADQDSGKPDHDKSEFTQKIVYTYKNQEVAYTTIDNIAKGSNLSAAALKNAIDSNVPANYTIQTGYAYPAARNDITATPAIIYVPLTHNTDDSFNANGQMVYQTADGTIVAHGKKIASHKGDTLSAGLLKDWADDDMTKNTHLKGYVIAQYPASYNVNSKNFTITVIVKAGTEVINPTNPKDPNQKDLFENVTRTINVHNPDGTVNVTKQVVHFDRTKTINAVTHEVISYGDWQLVAGSAKDWPEFQAPTIAGYTADPSSVAEKTVSADTKNETVDIYYHETNNGGGSDQPTQPTQPTQPNPNPQPSTPTPQPTAPSPEPKPEPQPTTPNNGGQKSNPGTNNKPKATSNGNQGHRAQGGQNAGNKGARGEQGAAKAAENGLNNHNGLGQKASGNGNNGLEAAQNNERGKQAKALPQTGQKQNSASIFGLALAGLAGLFGLAGDRKRNKR